MSLMRSCDVINEVTLLTIVVLDGKIHMLDLAAKLDSTAEYLCKIYWGDIEFPPPFGRDALPEVTAHLRWHEL